MHRSIIGGSGAARGQMAFVHYYNATAERIAPLTIGGEPKFTV